MKNNFLVLFFVLAGFAMSAGFALASNTNGTIDSTDKYAWSENAGWLNFGTSEGNVGITDSALTGYAWAENTGWISLNCSNNSSCSSVDYSVANDGDGNLSGYAYGENIGWINFNPTYGGVTVNSSGEFSGYAYGENIGWIVFNCAATDSCAAADYKVKTDYRPQGARPQCNNATDDDGDGKTDYPDDPGCSSLDDNDETDAMGGGVVGGGGGASAPIVPSQTEEIVVEEFAEEVVAESKPVEKIADKVSDIAGDVLKSFVPSFLKKKPKRPPEIQPEEPPQISIEDLMPKETPLAMRGEWNLLPQKALENFVLAPLPEEIRVLAQKFPELEKTFEQVGITKITDVGKLKTAELALPGLGQMEEMPTEIVFAKTGGRLIDFNIVLNVDEKGKPQQKITAVSGKPLQLAVKPDKPAKSIKGYLVFRSKERTSLLQMPFSSLSASLFFAKPVFARQQEKPVRVEEKLVLMEFEYTDPDGDGIYTAEIQAPLVDGEYEIITVIDFEDPELGRKEIRLITVIDPEGYIYERIKNQELRITGAVVSIHRFDSEAGKYEIWPGGEYQQENPQITGATGKYSFLVPEGSYYISVEAPGYLAYGGKPFQVKEGSGVHFNIELKTKYWWLGIFDWKTILLIFIAFLLAFNFYKDKRRGKINKQEI